MTVLEAANLSSYFSQADYPDQEHPFSSLVTTGAPRRALTIISIIGGDTGHASSIEHTTTGLWDMLGISAGTALC